MVPASEEEELRFLCAIVANTPPLNHLLPHKLALAFIEEALTSASVRPNPVLKAISQHVESIATESPPLAELWEEAAHLLDTVTKEGLATLPPETVLTASLASPHI